MPNHTALYIKNYSGTNRSAMHVTTGNVLAIGAGGYEAKEGRTTIYGNTIELCVQTKNGAIAYRPYSMPGDSITVTVETAGYITHSSKDVHFTVPVSRPLINVSTITAASVNGIMVRQGSKYLYGGSSSVYVKPSAYKAYYDGHSICVTASFNNTTNVVNNNDSCGVQASIKLTFS